jgi:hypothetical protein
MGQGRWFGMARLDRTRITEGGGWEILRPGMRLGLAGAYWLFRAGAALLAMVGGVSLLGRWAAGTPELHLFMGMSGILVAWAVVDDLLLPHVERVSRCALVRRRWRKAGARPCRAAELREAPIGQAVVVRGRVRASRVPGIKTAAPGGAVWTHVRYSVMSRTPLRRVPVLHDCAEDFEIVDEDGATVCVDVSGAHLVTADRPRHEAPLALRRQLLALVPPSTRCWLVAECGWRQSEVWAAERQLREGDTVTVYGFKDAALAPGGERLERQAPLEPCLRSAAHLPLVVWLD